MPATDVLTVLPSPESNPSTTVTDSLFSVCLIFLVSFCKSSLAISFPSSYMLQVVLNTLGSTPASLTNI